MGPPAEFSRIVKIDTLSKGKVELDLQATAAEAAALADRFGLVAIDRFAGRGRLGRQDAQIVFRGTLEADVVQTCVVTLEPFKASLSLPIERHFVEADTQGDDEIDPEIDIVSQDEIDVGEMLAEEFGLGLDPYPRSPEAAGMPLPGHEAGDDDDMPKSPFAKLRQRQDEPRGGSRRNEKVK